MKKLLSIAASVAIVTTFAGISWATNGDNLIGIGPISRAMGGVGIAAPQNAISAVFSNPAAMCVGPFCPNTEMDFAGTMFMPQVNARVSGPGIGGTVKADSNDDVYAIPALLIDLEQGKRIEVEALQGAAVRRAARHGVPTPIVSTLYATLKPWEAGDPRK